MPHGVRRSDLATCGDARIRSLSCDSMLQPSLSFLHISQSFTGRMRDEFAAHARSLTSPSLATRLISAYEFDPLDEVEPPWPAPATRTDDAKRRAVHMLDRSASLVTLDLANPRAKCLGRPIRTARSRTSGGYLVDLVMAPSSQGLGPPDYPARFNVLGCLIHVRVGCMTRIGGCKSCRMLPGRASRLEPSEEPSSPRSIWCGNAGVVRFACNAAGTRHTPGRRNRRAVLPILGWPGRGREDRR